MTPSRQQSKKGKAMSEVKKCPKCGAEMGNDRHLSSYTEISLAKENEYVGDRIRVFYCKTCDFMELYREKKT
jgi:predicted nucleic-acid-binding Zn-ribbon protein